jgi:hypothetical protein
LQTQWLRLSTEDIRGHNTYFSSEDIRGHNTYFSSRLRISGDTRGYPGTQYLFLQSFGLAAWLGGPHDSVHRSLDTIRKRALTEGPSRSRVTAQQRGFSHRHDVMSRALPTSDSPSPYAGIITGHLGEVSNTGARISRFWPAPDLWGRRLGDRESHLHISHSLKGLQSLFDLVPMILSLCKNDDNTLAHTHTNRGCCRVQGAESSVSARNLDARQQEKQGQKHEKRRGSGPLHRSLIMD